MMTRKDYVNTADILKAYQAHLEPNTFADLVEDFCILFANDNPNFVPSRFENACGLVVA